MEYFLQKQSDTLFIRLAPGDLFLEGIQKACQKSDIRYGTITSCIGSLSRTAYTYVKADSSSTTGIAYRDTITTDKANEVISANGTIGLNTDGAMDIHMHALMVDIDGTMFAGHMMPGCVVCATMEISIAVAETGQMIREYDEVLKFPLFHFKKN